MMMTTLGVIGPDLIGRQKSNYYRMMTMSTLSACKMTDVFMIYSSHSFIWYLLQRTIGFIIGVASVEGDKLVVISYLNVSES